MHGITCVNTFYCSCCAQVPVASDPSRSFHGTYSMYVFRLHLRKNRLVYMGSGLLQHAMFSPLSFVMSQHYQVESKEHTCSFRWLSAHPPVGSTHSWCLDTASKSVVVSSSGSLSLFITAWREVTYLNAQHPPPCPCGHGLALLVPWKSCQNEKFIVPIH